MLRCQWIFPRNNFPFSALAILQHVFFFPFFCILSIFLSFLPVECLFLEKKKHKRINSPVYIDSVYRWISMFLSLSGMIYYSIIQKKWVFLKFKSWMAYNFVKILIWKLKNLRLRWESRCFCLPWRWSEQGCESAVYDVSKPEAWVVVTSLGTDEYVSEVVDGRGCACWCTNAGTEIVVDRVHADGEDLNWIDRRL